MESGQEGLTRRRFLRLLAITAGSLPALDDLAFGETGAPRKKPPLPKYDWEKHRYGMLIDLRRCIGCGFCEKACRKENKVPTEPPCHRTWIERYILKTDNSVVVDSPDGGSNGFPADTPAEEIFRSFFVPKLCNHCEHPPCVQVCPVGATFRSKEGVVLVDQDYCIGCRYCIEACPYGARFLHPEKRTADKCTLCYHRVVKGLRPACVEVCPQNVRIFGDLEDPNSPLTRLLHEYPVQILKPSLNTEPRVSYLNLDKEVR